MDLVKNIQKLINHNYKNPTDFICRKGAHIMDNVNIVNWITAGGTVIAALVACIGFIMAIYQYMKESTRRKRSETLSLYTTLFKKTFDLRDNYKKKYPDTNLFDADLLHENPDLCNKVLNLLTKFESFAKGLQYGIYDFEIFIYLTPKEMLDILEALNNFVKKEKERKGYALLFIDFVGLYKRTDICMNKKMNHEKVPKKYKQVKA